MPSAQAQHSVITPLDRKDLLAAELLQEHKNWIDKDSEKYSHILIAELSTKYKKTDFNILSYLRKICCPKVKNTGRVMDSRIAYFKSIKTNMDAYIIKFDGKPTSGDKLTIAVNEHITVDVAMDKISWESIGSVGELNDAPKIMFFAANIKLSIDAPNFPLIRMARLIPAEDQATYLLDLVVENHSQVDLPLYGFMFVSKKRRDIACHMGSIWQPVYLNWSKTSSSSMDGFEASASTFLHGEKVNVSARYRGACSDGYNALLVSIPSVSTIPAGESERFGFKFVEDGNDYMSVKNLPTREISLFGEDNSLIDTILIQDVWSRASANKFINETQ